jgi:hypothetical protein
MINVETKFQFRRSSCRQSAPNVMEGSKMAQPSLCADLGRPVPGFPNFMDADKSGRVIYPSFCVLCVLLVGGMA